MRAARRVRRAGGAPGRAGPGAPRTAWRDRGPAPRRRADPGRRPALAVPGERGRQPALGVWLEQDDPKARRVRRRRRPGSARPGPPTTAPPRSVVPGASRCVELAGRAVELDRRPADGRAPRRPRPGGAITRRASCPAPDPCRRTNPRRSYRAMAPGLSAKTPRWTHSLPASMRVDERPLAVTSRPSPRPRAPIARSRSTRGSSARRTSPAARRRPARRRRRTR